jgi:hypothetical protein
MARGLKIPVGVDSTGGTAMVSEEDNAKQTIMTALSDCENDHAYQQNVGIGASMVFDINDYFIRARIMRRVEAIFREFEAQNRFKLKRETVKWEAKSGEGALILEFKYFDIESDEEKTFARVFTSSTFAGI